jgi:hypothetical protein
MANHLQVYTTSRFPSPRYRQPATTRKSTSSLQPPSKYLAFSISGFGSSGRGAAGSSGISSCPVIVHVDRQLALLLLIHPSPLRAGISHVRPELSDQMDLVCQPNKMDPVSDASFVHTPLQPKTTFSDVYGSHRDGSFARCIKHVQPPKQLHDAAANSVPNMKFPHASSFLCPSSYSLVSVFSSQSRVALPPSSIVESTVLSTCICPAATPPFPRPNPVSRCVSVSKAFQ